MSRIIDDIQLDYSDVVIAPHPSEGIVSRKDVDLTRSIKYDFIRGIPMINSNMSTTGTLELAREMLKAGMFATLHKHYKASEVVEFMKSLEEDQRPRFFIPIGMRDTGLNINDLKFIRDELIKDGKFPGNILLDVPNAYIEPVIKLVENIRNIIDEDGNGGLLMVGNVCDIPGCQDLFEAGADIIKIGVAPGSKCRTRDTTGVARPQFSAVYECARCAHENGKFICADGGLQNSGDVCKAFAAGADIVMSGFLYAGTYEASGDIVDREDGIYKLYYGMASSFAQKIYNGGIAEYRTSEGACGLIKYTGRVSDMNKHICGALRSCMTYVGVKNLQELGKTAFFYKVNNPHISHFDKEGD